MLTILVSIGLVVAVLLGLLLYTWRTHRRQAGHWRAQSEQHEKIAGLLERMQPAVYRMAVPEGRYEFLNPAAEVIFGYSRQQMLDQPLLVREAVHPEFREYFEDQWQKLRQGHVDPVYEYRIIDAGGRERWVRQANTGVFDAAGRIVAIEGCCWDVTAQKEAEIELAASHAMLTEVLDHSRDILYRRNVQTNRYHYISRAFQNILGYTREDVDALAFEGVAGLIHPQDRPAHEAFLDQTMQDRDAGDAQDAPEYRLRGKDGRYRWFNDRITIVRDDQGDPLFVVGNNREITAQKAADEALRHAHELLLTVLDSLDAHIYVADLETYEIRFMNRKMKEDFGGSLEGRICYQVFRRETAPCAHCTNDQLRDAAGRPTQGCVWEGQNPVTQRWYLNHDRAIQWVDGKWVRIQIATDVTAIKQVEDERLKTAEKYQQVQKLEAIGTLAGGVAHDFNNLLMGIQGHVSLLQSELAPEDRRYERTRQIDTLIERATRLTRQLLGYARKGQYEIRPLQFNTILAEVAEAFGRTRKDIRVAQDLEAQLWAVEADQGQLEQVLWSLLTNASDAMPAGGDLALKTRNCRREALLHAGHTPPSEHYIRLEVRDTGCGMEAAMLSRIFDPFFTTKPMGSGTGLGLAAVYGIVKGHGGFIDVQSTVEQGTTFTIDLPARAPAAPKVADVAAAPAAKASGRLLLVDDEAFIREIGVQMLEHLGYEVVVAESGEEACEIYRQQGDTIDLVILDLIMPGLGGSATFERLREMDSEVRVLLSSGYSIEGQATELLQRGCAGFIQKPFGISQLDEKLRGVIKG